MSVSVTLTAALSVVETLETNVPATDGTTNARVTHNGWNESEALNSASTPPATKVAAFEQAMTAGAASIDLTALSGTNGATVDATGLKLQALLVKAPSANSAVVKLADGASNGYGGFGADFAISLSPGQWALLFGDDDTPDVASDAKTLDLSGTGTDELQIEAVFG